MEGFFHTILLVGVGRRVGKMHHRDTEGTEQPVPALAGSVRSSLDSSPQREMLGGGSELTGSHLECAHSPLPTPLA